MITRNSIINYDINENEGSELFLEEEIVDKTDGDINKILDIMYEKNGISPLSMIWELTQNCNFNCPFCYVCSLTNSKEMFSKFEDMKQGLNELIDRGLFVCYLTGGEPLLHPDFEEIYLYLKKRGVLVAVLSNASLLTERHFELFSKYKPYKIEVSIYGISNTFAKTNSFAVAKRVLENVLRLKKLGIYVIAKFPYNNCTEHEYESVKEWCISNDIDFICSDELFDKYDGTSNSIYKRNKEKNDDVKEYVFGHKKIFDCSAGKHSFVLSYNGKIRPCFAFYENKAPNWNFDSRKQGLTKAYDQMKQQIEKIVGKKLKYCKGCDKYLQCQECIATQCLEKDVKAYMESMCSNI